MLGSLFGAIAASTISSAAIDIAETAFSGIVNSKKADLRMKQMDMAMRENPGNYIQVLVDSSEFYNQHFYHVVKNLAGMGFYDINIREILTAKGLLEKPRTGLVNDVVINGARKFDRLSFFPKDSHVVVEAVVHRGDNHLYMPELNAIRQGSVMYQRPVMRCQYCGVAISNGQKYCIGCGAPL